MEHSPFSNQGLDPEVLKQEEKIWALAIERTQEALEKDVDFEMIADLFQDIFRKCLPLLSEAELTARLEKIRRPEVHVKYSLVEIDNTNGFFTSHGATTNGEVVRYSAREFCNEGGEVDLSNLTMVTIHELLHMATWRSKDSGTGVEFFTGIDYQKQIHGGQLANFFLGANEGLTEMITDAVYAEYLARKGELVTRGNQEYLHLSFGSFDLPQRYMTYESEREDVGHLVQVLKKATGFSSEVICQTLTREYFSNGSLVREEVLEEFKDFPEVSTLLGRLKRNVALNPKEDEPYTWNENAKSEDERYYDFEDSHLEENMFAKALFGRDVIGTHNQNVVDSL